MKILITGATGLVGKELGKRLAKNGHELVAVARDKAKASQTLPFAATIVEWKDYHSDFPAQAFEGVNGVIHLMGENLSTHRWTSEYKKKIEDSRILSTQKMVQAYLEYQKANPSVLEAWVQGSAIGIYGEAKGAEVFDESSATGSGFLADLCVAWEKAIDPLPSQIRKVFLRTGVVFSHQGGAFPTLLEPAMLGIGGKLGDGKQKMSIIHLDDEARFIQHAVENKNVSGAFNLTASVVSQEKLIQEIGDVFNLREGPAAPKIILKAVLGEMANMILENEPVVSARFAEVGFELKFKSLRAILENLFRWYQDPAERQNSAHLMYGEQFVPKPIDEVFAFFSDAKNLEDITPGFLNFSMKSTSTEKLEKGTEIKYDLKLHGIPFEWVTDIAEWDPPHVFVDNQRKGPYSLWYHEHRFDSVAGGTLLRDWVRYRLPLGKVGQWVAGMKVKKDVQKIFDFRREVIAKQMGQK